MPIHAAVEPATRRAGEVGAARGARARADRAVAARRCAHCGCRLGSRPVWRDGRPYCDVRCASAVPGLYLG